MSLRVPQSTAHRSVRPYLYGAPPAYLQERATAEKVKYEFMTKLHSTLGRAALIERTAKKDPETNLQNSTPALFASRFNCSIESSSCHLRYLYRAYY